MQRVAVVHPINGSIVFSAQEVLVASIGAAIFIACCRHRVIGVEHHEEPLTVTIASIVTWIQTARLCVVRLVIGYLCCGAGDVAQRASIHGSGIVYLVFKVDVVNSIEIYLWIDIRHIIGSVIYTFCQIFIAIELCHVIKCGAV